jgi:hypothetical protein
MQHVMGAAEYMTARCVFLKEQVSSFVWIACNTNAKGQILRLDDGSKVSSMKGIQGPTEFEDLLSVAWEFIVEKRA